MPLLPNLLRGLSSVHTSQFYAYFGPLLLVTQKCAKHWLFSFPVFAKLSAQFLTLFIKNDFRRVQTPPAKMSVIGRPRSDESLLLVTQYHISNIPSG